MDLTSYSVHTLSQLLDKKEISSTELTKAFLDNISRKDVSIGAYITVCSELALKCAELSDKRVLENSRLGPLDGIPYALKDNICTSGIRTTCASKMLKDFVPPYDATVYSMLKNAGAVLLGKLNMDEFAMGSTTAYSAFHHTNNPHSLTHCPGGSSGGSAASVAARMSAFALGSDTGGSVRQPACFCGAVGLVPTYGTVSRFGLVEFSSSLEQIGVITQNTIDNAMVLDCIAGKDPRDETTVDNTFRIDTTKMLCSLDNLKIAVPVELMSDSISKSVKNAVENALGAFTELGATVEYISIPQLCDALAAYYIISCAEVSSNLARFDGVRYGSRSESFETPEELYIKSRGEFLGDEVKRRILVGTYVLGNGFREKYYDKAIIARREIRNAVCRVFEKYDIIACPTAPTSAFKHGLERSPLETYLEDICTVPANLAGIPAISVPCGIDCENSDLPMGLQLMAKPLAEALLYSTSYAYEKWRDSHENH